jgi:uncharacterized lipoprotein YajG
MIRSLSRRLPLLYLAGLLALAACDSDSPTTTANDAAPQDVQGIATPASVSVVTAKNAN